jgi:APA family basic amino acid/polyamine antiporter
MLCWVVGGLFALSGALCYAELGAMFPQAGGEYVYLRESLGRLAAFLSGWISLIVGFSAPIAASAIAFATYALSIFGPGTSANASLLSPANGLNSISQTAILGVGVILLFSLLHYRGLKFGTKVQNWLTAFKVLLLVGIGVAGLALGRGDVAHLHENLQVQGIFSHSFAVSLIFISFAYSGWNAATYLGAEIRQPARNLPRALIGGTLMVVVIYLLVNAVYLYAVPADVMAGAIDVGVMAAKALFGETSGRVVSAGIAVCILSVISAMILTGPRVYYAMARDRLFFCRFARLSPSSNTPGWSIFLQAFLAIIMVLTATFDALLIYIGFTLSLFACLTVIGMVVLRIKYPALPRPYRTWGYPFAPLFFIVGNLWIIFVSVQSRPVASLSGLATIAVGILVYLYIARKS